MNAIQSNLGSFAYLLTKGSHSDNVTRVEIQKINQTLNPYCETFHRSRVLTKQSRRSLSCSWVRGVTRLDGARGKKQVRHPNVQTWSFSEANIL